MSQYLEKVLDTFRVVAVALSANPLDLLDLACLASSLDVLEVNFRILAKVHNGAQEVKQTCKTQIDSFRNEAQASQVNTPPVEIQHIDIAVRMGIIEDFFFFLQNRDQIIAINQKDP